MTRTLVFAAAAAFCASSALAASAPGPSASGGGDNPGAGAGIVAPVAKTGEEVYKYICQACHMADAKGGVGAGTIPALAANPKLAAPGYPIIMVLNGRGAMPAFRDALTPEQISGVVGYIRTHFG
ncbi:MAG: hypothetical protein B7Y99_08950 [Caulobacterales bacterium 32-69-10]|nr:MAG: hypothetical protein B7Y99_08950 [Caulobacterales bacterium 32-69-10]